MERKNNFCYLTLIVGVLLFTVLQLRNLYYYSTEVNLRNNFMSEVNKYNTIINKDLSYQLTTMDKFDFNKIMSEIDSIYNADNPFKIDEFDEIYIDTKVKIIRIPSIDFEQIVMEDASRESLKISIGLVSTQKNNITFAGHRSDVYGRNFNRLNEVVKDQFIILVDEKFSTYYFEVTEKFVVDKDDIWILDPYVDKQTVTLITCTKDYNSSNRLIVRGKLVKKEMLESQ